MGACLSAPNAPESGHNVGNASPAKEQPKIATHNDPGCLPSVTPGRDCEGNENVGAELDRNTMEELDYVRTEPTSLQEELNEILEAMFEMISEEEIQAYQTFLDDIEKHQISQKAAKARSRAPDFTLMDQDDEPVRLSQLVQKGPVVLQFYRGKWCPHCNAGLMKYQEYVPQIQSKGATLVAISPMLPDGTQFLATKRDLQFTVASDCGNEVAKQYKITFVVPKSVRPNFEEWGYDVPKNNGDDLWELPLAATYIINQQQEIVWSFLDNDFGIWAEPKAVVQALDKHCETKQGNATTSSELVNTNSQTRGHGSIVCRRKSRASMYGPKKAPAGEFLARYKPME